MKTDFTPKSAMSIHAHPDDQDFTVAGTLAKWAKAGSQIVSVIITSGDAGSNDPGQGPAYKAELARLREEEQRQANALLGIAETAFLRYPDGELTPSLGLRRDLTRLIRRYVVFPSAGTRMIFTELLDEGLAPHDVRRLYVHGTEKPDTWVDIADTIDLKIQALRMHSSQRDTHDSEKMIRDWAEAEGQSPGLRYAESFRVMILQRDEDSPRE